MARRLSPQRSEVFRLREYDRKIRQMKRQDERRGKVRLVEKFGGKS